MYCFIWQIRWVFANNISSFAFWINIALLLNGTIQKLNLQFDVDTNYPKIGLFL